MCVLFVFFFFNDTATTEIYTLSLHDALPIWSAASRRALVAAACSRGTSSTAFGNRKLFTAPNAARASAVTPLARRSEEHTSELQSLAYLVCRLLLEKKKKHTTRLKSNTPSPP